MWQRVAGFLILASDDWRTRHADDRAPPTRDSTPRRPSARGKVFPSPPSAAAPAPFPPHALVAMAEYSTLAAVDLGFGVFGAGITRSHRLASAERARAQAQADRGTSTANKNG